MNLDKGIINHWANLFECEEAKKNGTYVAEEIGSEQVDEATIKGFSREDFETQGVIKHINDEFQRAKLKSWSAEILGSGEDFTIALTDSSSQPPNYDTEYYSADGAYDAWYEAKEYEYQEATKIAFECVDHFITHASDNLQFVTTFKDGDYDEQSRTIYKMVPKARAKKAIDDAIRNLVDSEYNQMRKIPQQKRQKFFRDHSWPRFALMAATNKEYIGARTDGVGSYSMNGCGRMLMDMAEKIGAYSWEDFQNLVGNEDLETGFDMDDPIEKQRRIDQDAEFDDATMNIREGEKQDDNQNDADNKEKIGDAMSPAEIMASWNKNHADDEKKAAEEKARKEAEAQARGIKQIIITSVSDDGTIRYTIVKNDGTEKEDVSKGVGTDDEEFKRTKRMLRTMSGKTPDDLDVFVAMLRRAFDSASKTPIQWYYHFDKGDEGRLDDDWYYRPSEDYLGYTPDFVQSIFDAGGRVPGMI